MTEETEETVEETTEVATEVKTEEAPVKKNKTTARERIDQLSRQKGDRDRIIADKDQEIAALKANQRIDKKPSEDDYDTFEEFNRDNEKFEAQQTTDSEAEINRRVNDRLAQRDNEKSDQKLFDNYEKSKSVGVKKYENYSDSEQYVALISNRANNADFQKLVMGAKNPAAIIDHLANNQKVAENLVKDSLVSAASSIAELDTKLSQKKKADDLPPPTDNAGESGSGVFDPNTATQAEYNAHYNNK